MLVSFYGVKISSLRFSLSYHWVLSNCGPEVTKYKVFQKLENPLFLNFNTQLNELSISSKNVIFKLTSVFRLAQMCSC